MAQAAQRPPDANVFRLHRDLDTTVTGRSTRIHTAGGISNYSVSRGPESLSGEIAWSVGDGRLGNTFLLRRNGDFYESQLSYFTASGTLDLTPGHSQTPFQSIEDSFGQRLSSAEAARCLACHTTRSSEHNRFTPQNALPGIECEACHGPGSAHVKAMENKDFEKGRDAILNVTENTPVQQLDFCGACHRAPRDVTDTRDFTAINVRFQPYRLSKSRCWSKPDARLACTACHNPHRELNADLLAYDSKCLACHGNRDEASRDVSDKAMRNEASCPTATSNCVKCHMPRYYIPNLHGAFTDHYIRVVRPNERFPL